MFPSVRVGGRYFDAPIIGAGTRLGQREYLPGA